MFTENDINWIYEYHTPGGAWPNAQGFPNYGDNHWLAPHSGITYVPTPQDSVFMPQQNFGQYRDSLFECTEKGANPNTNPFSFIYYKPGNINSMSWLYSQWKRGEHPQWIYPIDTLHTDFFKIGTDYFDTMKLINPNIMRYIRRTDVPKCYLMFMVALEGDASANYNHCLNRMETWAKHNNIPAEKILLGDGNARFNESMEEPSTVRHFFYHGTQTQSMYFADELSKHLNLGLNIRDINLTDEQRHVLTEYRRKQRPTHKYITLNRAPRSHRYVLVFTLMEQQMQDDGLISLGSDVATNFAGQRCDWFDDDTAARYEQWYNTTHKEGLELDCDLSINRAADFNFDLYNQAYYQLVSETYFEDANYENANSFISEKTYKPIANLQPFVLYSPAKTLAVLHKLGYKTFDKWWDESYNDIEDDQERHLAIIELTKTLNAIPLEEWQLMIMDMLPTLLHNYELLLNIFEWENTVLYKQMKSLLRTGNIIDYQP
jgi:hypothetical protein